MVKMNFFQNEKSKYKNILYLSFDGDGPMYDWPKHHFINELKRHDINVDQIKYSQNHSIAQLSRSVRQHVIDNETDLILCALDDTVVKDELAYFLKNVGLPKILMCQDNLSVPFKHKKCCKLFDLVWLTSKETEYLFKRWGANTCFLPYAANPYAFKPTSQLECDDYEIAFIGSLYGMRKIVIKKLLSAEIKLKVYGKENGDQSPIKSMSKDTTQKLLTTLMLSRFHIGRKAIVAGIMKSLTSFEEVTGCSMEISPQLPFRDIPDIYSRSKLSLGSFELWNTYLLKKPIYKLHLRTFEIPMSGGIQLANNIPELSGYFDHGKEILFYNCHEELVDLTKYYSNEKRYSLRQSMKKSARYRSLNEHTWNMRFQKLISNL